MKKISSLVLLLVLMPAIAMAQEGGFDPLDFLAGLNNIHPALLPIVVMIVAIMKVADCFIKEDKKAEWPASIRKVWDWSLLHVGQSRNKGSVDG